MRVFQVTGMSCAACSSRVERAVSGLPGVDSCAVNLLTGSLAVEGSATDEAIVDAVEKAGYGCRPEQAKTAARDKTPAVADEEFVKLRRCLILSVGFVIVLMYISMGYHMFSAPLPGWLQKPSVNALCQMILTLIVMGINYRFFRNGVRGVLHGAPNMDTLVALGSFASFAYSAVRTAQIFSGAGGHEILGDLYFDSAAMILALITVGKTLEAYSKGRTTDALKGLYDLAPKQAKLIRDGVSVTVPIAEVKVGDVFEVFPGDAIPTDGVILEGESAIDESALTGESIPVDKKPGDAVATATLNRSGHILCRATAVGEDNTLAKIIRMVSDATATKAPIAKMADRVAGVFVPVVIAIAAITVVIWLLVGQTFGYALARGVSVLVISCPCALGLATPVAIMVGSGVGAKHGILYKNATALEQCGRVETVAFDKTGTITEGEPKVTEVVPADGVTEEGLLRYAYIAEQYSEHPIAKAIRLHAQESGAIPVSTGDETKSGAARESAGDSVTLAAEGFKALSGNGVRVTYGGKELLGGNLRLLGDAVPKKSADAAEAASREGGTPVFFAYDGQYLGMITVADTLRADSAGAIELLQNMNITTVCVTGDRKATAEVIAARAGITEVRAEVLPDGKQQVIRELQFGTADNMCCCAEEGGSCDINGNTGNNCKADSDSEGSRKANGKATADRRIVAMVGDGINDAPALTAADIGIAIGAGTEIAIDAGDVVVMNRRLTDVCAAIDLGRSTLRIIRQNLWWAFFYNVIGIPLAAGAYVKLFGWEMNPMFGAAAMSLSSFCVVMNALRLNRWKYPEIDGAETAAVEAKEAAAEVEAKETEETKVADAVDRPATADNTSKEDVIMKEITLQVKGMMCMHCEARVKKCLEEIPGVSEAIVSHEKGTAVVTAEECVSVEKLTAAIVAQGYEVV
ncbi:MAG: heavy metal translocating P-type ATPase [Lachnospiraceae bacterium]|nr:heavy metal translocating P-type ATPase [Lachnospiraceae bacterium]